MPHSASEVDARELPREGDAPLQFGKYRLARLLARGGMGEVYLARLVGELGFEKQLVIKTILPELAAKKRFIELFAAEAKTAVALSHGNIVPTYELGRSNDTFYIVMGYVDGPSVAQLLAACKREGREPDPAVALHIIRGVLSGLAYAHHEAATRPAVVHRDITPRNILLDRSGQVRIVDFGIAAPAKAERGIRAGSTGFVAPEQARGDVPDPRADVFSVGCLLYELCTHRRAFPKEGVWVTPDLGGVPPIVREPLAAALSFEPDGRPRDAAALMTLLRPAIFELAGNFDDQGLAAFIRELFPDGWGRSGSERSGVNPIRGFEGDNETFATRLTSVTNIGREAPASPERRADETPNGSAHRLAPTDATTNEPERKTPMLPILLGAAAIGVLAIAFGGDDESPAPQQPAKAEPVPVAVGAPPDTSKVEPTEAEAPPEPEPEAPPPPPEPEPQVHRLAVDPPDAEVRVDGHRLRGASPHRIEVPTDGALSIEVRKPGYDPRTLRVAPGDAPPARVVLHEVAPKDPGFLRVTAPGVPWAEVRVDGKTVGNTPTRKLRIPAGRHRVEVECIPDACTESQVLLSKTITIEPNQLRTLKSGR